MTDASGETTRSFPFVLGIVGDSGSGKSTVARGVRTLIGPERVTAVELDDYHRYSRAERQERELTSLNPLVHNLSLMQEHLQLLRRGRPVRNRHYDHSDGTFGPIRVITPSEVVLVRGLLGFATPELLESYDLSVFLYPEPELLFRWKLRRDVKTRGYSEAEVLSYIAQHLLDSKQFVRPQADRADLVVCSEVPDWDAPDTEVRSTLVLRRAAAEAVRTTELPGALATEVGREEKAGELHLHLPETLSLGAVEAWAAMRFPSTFTPGALGVYGGEGGEDAQRASLAFAQVLIAHLTQELRRTVSEAPPRG